jgi:hypothetical protein
MSFFRMECKNDTLVFPGDFVSLDHLKSLFVFFYDIELVLFSDNREFGYRVQEYFSYKVSFRIKYIIIVTTAFFHFFISPDKDIPFFIRRNSSCRNSIYRVKIFGKYDILL